MNNKVVAQAKDNTINGQTRKVLPKIRILKNATRSSQEQQKTDTNSASYTF